jgi:two-component system sensor histidine kinase KdpD
MKAEERRSDPDELLARLKVEEERQKRGKLKIFLGYAPGVGKTYTMLESARARKSEVDLVVALVEAHGRTETEALLQGLEVIPRTAVEYRGIRLAEMDVDAVLNRHPQLVLVDELAHSNSDDSRHPKRYQDIEELLQAGIDVYTTLNVQHIESARNLVAQITGVWMRETVPDSVIDSANDIELVDLPPDELLKRLREGRVYVPEQIADATERYFRKGNLTALRELAIRTVAGHVDEQTQTYMEAHGVPGPWASGERLLVCIGHDILGTRLARQGRRLAHQMSAKWFVIHVETSIGTPVRPDIEQRLAGTLRLAEQMGARVATLQADSVVAGILEFATKNNIDKIVVGRPSTKWWKRWSGSSPADQIIRRARSFEVVVVGGAGETRESPAPPKTELFANWRGYLKGIGLVVVATLLGELLRQVFSPTTVLTVYLLCVMLSAILWGQGPSVLVAFAGVLAFDFFFVPPAHTFRVEDTQYLITFAALLLVGVIISYLTTRIRRQTEAARERERQTAALYALARDLAVSNDLDSYLRAVIERTKDTFSREAVVFLPDPENQRVLKPHTDSPGPSVDEGKMAAAIWSFEHRTAIGRGTDTLPNVEARYFPMTTARATLGVLALWMPDGVPELTVGQEQLATAYANLAAVAVEGLFLAEEAHTVHVLKETQKLQTALLNAISHDLRTPLVSIVGVLSSLDEQSLTLDDASRSKLIEVAREEADRLNHLITNLLDESRIEGGALVISRQPAEVQDLVGAALEQLGEHIGSRPIHIDIRQDLPFIPVDSGLFVQALFNVLDNALKYSPPGSPIEIAASSRASEVRIEIRDRGVGIPAHDLTRVFDKFYRIRSPYSVTGTGLGLSICKGIVEAHGGQVVAENRRGGGTVIRITLPLGTPGTTQEKNREQS